MTGNNVTLDFDTENASPAPQPFVADLGGFRFHREESDRDRRARLEGLLEQEDLLGFWRQYFAWLSGQTERFGHFFHNPAGNYSALGLTISGLSETFTATNAFAGGYSVSLPVGEDKLTIEPKKIIVETGYEFPRQGILAAVAIALKNPAFRNASGVTITADDADLLAFAYGAFKTAGLTIRNEAEILANLNAAGAEAWTNFASEPEMRAALSEFPELAALLKIGTTRVAPQTEAAATPDLRAAVENLPAYAPAADIKPYTDYNVEYPRYSDREILDLLEEGHQFPDIRRLSSVGLVHGIDAQKQTIVGQVAIRAIKAIVHFMDTPETFKKYLTDTADLGEGKTRSPDRLGMTDARADEIVTALYEPLKAARQQALDAEGKVDLKKLLEQEGMADAVAALVESQHNTQDKVPEHFVAADTREIVAEKLLVNEGFLKEAAFALKKGPLEGIPYTGPIAKALGFTNRHDVQATTVDGKPIVGQSVSVDVTDEVAQMLFAVYRTVTLPKNAIDMVGIKSKHKFDAFPIVTNEDKTLSLKDGIWTRVVGSQYAAQLLRMVAGVELEGVDAQKFEMTRMRLAYVCAGEASELLEAERAYETQNGNRPQIMAGINHILGGANALREVARERLEGHTQDLDTANPMQTASVKATIIHDLEDLYLKAARKAGVSEEQIIENVNFLSRARSLTEVGSKFPTFASLPADTLGLKVSKPKGTDFDRK